ncbi:MAG: hypothetical protein K6G30_06305 [Acetatifactor sp.]|nr:hypothetical protein [Acetatifactor sp.]
MENRYFTQALSDFMFDMASGGAIRHLASQGYSVTEISQKLKFPTPIAKIKETVWKYLLETGVIALTDPADSAETEKVSYVKEYSSTGKASFRRVTEKIEKPMCEYFACDFGKQMYQDREAFERKLEGLNVRDKEYLLGLPWPLQTVYHIADERMTRIWKHLQDKE